MSFTGFIISNVIRRFFEQVEQQFLLFVIPDVI